ncbi:MAG: alpha/beta hydrolase [Ahniella sp.]|nr:alpha/beta hydrolase [Ahniella sp.]
MVCPELQPQPAGLADTAYADYLAQLTLSIQAEGPPWIVIGASLGGLLAIDLAQGEGTRQSVAALVLVNPVPPAPFAAQVVWEPPSGAIEPWAKTASLVSTTRAVPDADPATWDWLWRLWRDESALVLRQVQSGIELARPTCPVLMLISEEDDSVPAAVSAQVADWLHADRLLLAGASHVGPLLGKRAAETAARVLSWLGYRLPL